MTVVEVRDSDLVRQYILQGLWLNRSGDVSKQAIVRTLDWAMQLAADDDPVPSVGMLADIAQLILADGPTVTAERTFEHLPADVARQYEDYVLGKFYSDATFERGATAVCRYQGNDRNRGIVWLVARFMQRADAGGIRCSPNVIRAMQGEIESDLLKQGSKSLSEDGLMPMLHEHYQQTIAGVRKLGEILAPEDVFELEHETALVQFGQRLALRQVLSACNQLQTELPPLVPNSYGRDRSVATNLVAEDTYPVGGFTSISTRGSIESLLQSQLAFMEQDDADRPDLFDMKYLRSELLYYSRDENEFLRRRRTFVFALYPNLINCRVKDDHIPCQRIIMQLAMIYVCVCQLTEWLSNESLKFEILLVKQQGVSPLGNEQELISMLLRKQVEAGEASVRQVTNAELSAQLQDRSRTSLTHCIGFSCADLKVEVDNVLVTGLLVSEPVPSITWERETERFDDEELNGWSAATDQLLKLLV